MTLWQAALSISSGVITSLVAIFIKAIPSWIDKRSSYAERFFDQENCESIIHLYLNQIQNCDIIKITDQKGDLHLDKKLMQEGTKFNYYQFTCEYQIFINPQHTETQNETYNLFTNTKYLYVYYRTTRFKVKIKDTKN